MHTAYGMRVRFSSQSHPLAFRTILGRTVCNLSEGQAQIEATTQTHTRAMQELVRKRSGNPAKGPNPWVPILQGGCWVVKCN